MNHSESQLDYPLGDLLPAPGALAELAPGLCWLRMPLPFALDHINLWLLRDQFQGRNGWASVDCGVANDSTRSAWDQVRSPDISRMSHKRNAYAGRLKTSVRCCS